MGIMINDTVIVQKAGEIIPEVVRVDADKRNGSERKFVMPDKCPVCGALVVTDAVSYTHLSEALFEAQHINELKSNGTTHVRIDYKNSGLGSHSCGPELMEKYRVLGKNIDFSFSIKM